MGWKALKEKFGITHNVQVTEEGVCIGSGYVHNLATINPQTGEVDESPAFGGFMREHYPQLLEASPADLVALIQAPDQFSASITVYTHENGDIVEKQCETPGWPNVTHDGCMMYENTYSTSKAQVVDWAKRNAALAVRCTEDDLARRETELAECRTRLAEYRHQQEKLEAAYPASEQTA